MTDEERIDEVKNTLSSDFMACTGLYADELRGDNDVWVEGWLSEITEWAMSWRSEIEELG